jgi:hypothetical protein
MNMYLELDDETRIPVSVITWNQGKTTDINHRTKDIGTTIATFHNPEMIFHATALAITGYVATPDTDCEGNKTYIIQSYYLHTRKK